jgi:hypothetical protein
MRATMRRQRRAPDPPFELEIVFEPRRDGRDALNRAYDRLVPPIVRRIGQPLQTGEDGHEEQADAAGSSRDADTCGALCARVHRSTS